VKREAIVSFCNRYQPKGKLKMTKPETKTTTPCLDIPVSFGGVSIGDQTARIGVKISRECLNIDAADEALCGKRLVGKVVLGHNGDSAGQGKLFDGADHEISGAFDVKRFSVGPKEITAGLTFSLGSIDLSELGHFAKQSGRMLVESILAIPDDAANEDADGGEDDDSFAMTDRAANAADELQGAWRKASLADVGLRDGDIKKLGTVGVTTAGELQDRMQKHGQFWASEITGFGLAAKDRIEDSFNAFVSRAEAA
jgi:hypothetical protein